MDTAQFLTLLYSRVPDGALECTFITPEGIDRAYGEHKIIVHWKPMPLVIEDAQFTRVHELNARGYGAYFGTVIRADRKHPEERTSADGRKYIMQYPRGTQKDARWLTCLWVDVDGGAGYENLALVRSLNPTVIVRSGGGYHGYLVLRAPVRIDDSNRDDVKALLKAAAKKVGADSHSAELARVLRLPGTVNTKPERKGAVCEVIECSGELFTLGDLRTQFAEFLRVQPRVTRAIPVEARPDLPEWVQEYLVRGASQGFRNAKLFAVACRMRESGIPQSECEQTAGVRAAADGLSWYEINRTIESAYMDTSVRPSTPTRASMAMRDRVENYRKGDTK